MLKKTTISFKYSFFVDRNIIEDYINGVPSICRFIQNPNHKFFYTETILSEWLIPESGGGNLKRISPKLISTLKELDKGKDYNVKEHFGDVSESYRKFFLERTNEYFKYLDSPKQFDEILVGDLDKYFTFRHSGISLTQKYFALGKLQEQWDSIFSEEMYPAKQVLLDSEKVQFPLTAKKIKKFEKDLFIIFEASKACCYDISTASAPLVTNNLDFFEVFLGDKEREGILENTINLSGFEHLIDIESWINISNHY